MRDILKQIYAFAKLPGEKAPNPADEVGPASIATFVPKDRSLSPSEIRVLFKAIGTTGRRYFIRTAVPSAVAAPRRRTPAAPLSSLAEPATGNQDPVVAKAIESGRKAISHGLSLLIRGETGSGKEVVARALHDEGKPFVALNCSAVPESLMEAELFGYADGAFTGARKGGSVGAIEQADGGTLFLDEIGDATPALQAKLLRVLQEGTFCRLGSRREVRVDINVISATHRDLKRMIAEGTFRDDLYYRLNGISVTFAASGAPRYRRGFSATFFTALV